MSRSQWAWTKSGIGHLARALSSLIAIGRVATVVMVVLASFFFLASDFIIHWVVGLVLGIGR